MTLPCAISQNARRLVSSDYLVLALALLYFAALAPFTPGLASPSNLINLAAFMLPLAIVAAGQTLVIISGGIDLSITATIALASVVGAQIMSADNGWLSGHSLAIPCAIAAMLLVGAAIGALNGFLVAIVRMPAFIVTLTVMIFFSGFAVWFTQSQNIAGLPKSFVAIGERLPIALPLTAAILLAAEALLAFSLFGRWLYAAGLNPGAARVSGVPVRFVVFMPYVLSGLCAAAASVLYTGRMESGSPVMGEHILLDVIGATVIGGTSLFGGKGRIISTVCGVLFITLIDNSLNLLNLSHFAVMIVKGAVILAAALIDAARTRLNR